MSEVEKRATGVVAGAVGNTIGPTVTGMMIVAGVVTGDFSNADWLLGTGAGAVAGAAAQAGVEVAGEKARAAVDLVRQVTRDRAERVALFARRAALASGRSEEELLDAAAADLPLRTLLGETVHAASTAHDDWKVDMLAKVFAAGARDGAMVDPMLIFAKIAKDLEAGHARILRAFLDLGHQNAHSPESLAQADPGLNLVAGVLMDQLRTLGLTTEGWGLTQTGRFAMGWLRDLGVLPARVTP